VLPADIRAAQSRENDIRHMFYRLLYAKALVTFIPIT
jgi:hypothetical protein